jgi:hypothetical protein
MNCNQGYQHPHGGVKWLWNKKQFKYRCAPVSTGNIFQDLPRLRETADNTERYTWCVKKYGEWYQKTNKREDTNKLTLLTFKIIAILHSTLLTTFKKLLETVSKSLFRNRAQNRCHTSWIAATSVKHVPFMMLFRRGNIKKSTHRTPLIWRPEAPDQGSVLCCEGWRLF